MSLFLDFMKDPSKDALAHRMCATKNHDPQKGGTLTTCCEIIYYLLATYSTEDWQLNQRLKYRTSDSTNIYVLLDVPISCGNKH